MRRTLSAAVTATVAAVALVGGGLATVPAAAADAAPDAQAAKCHFVEAHPSDNGVKLINKCKKTWKARVANDMWPDTGCQHIRPGHSWYYESPTKIEGVKNC